MDSFPTELLACIIQCLRPIGFPVAIPAEHEVTRALLALTRVSSTFRSLAIPYLYTYCLYIDSPRRLQSLLRSFPGQKEILRNQEHISRQIDRRTTPGCLLNHPPRALQSLYLAPFTEDTIDELPVVIMLSSLFELFSHFLVRLVIDMPLRSFFPVEDRQQIRPTLREAFLKLTTLEEFTSARDELFLDICFNEGDEFVVQPLVWSFWPQLKHLALYNVDMENQTFIDSLKKLGKLDVLVLTRADGDEDTYITSLLAIKGLRRLSIVNIATFHPQQPPISGPGRKPTVSDEGESQVAELIRINVPILQDDAEQEVEICQAWTRDHAIDGTLWDCTDGHD